MDMEIAFSWFNQQNAFIRLNPLPDDNFKFDENGRKLSKQVENTLGKGEIAHYKQCLFFPQCFQKACFPGASKAVVMWEWVKICLIRHTTIGLNIITEVI